MVFDSLSELVSHLNNVTFQDDPDILGFEVTGEITGYKTRPWNDIVFINFQLQEDIGKGKFLKLACNTREDRCRFTGFEGSPKDGDKVTVKASLQYNRNISILQADVFEMRNTGKGDLLLKFQEIKERLAKEGLFDEDRKKELPVLPRRIGLITGSDGTEGRRDFLDEIECRSHYYDIHIYNARMQGENCPPQIIAGLDYFEKVKDDPDKRVDVIVITRGGGDKYTDFVCFNDEALARRVSACTIPVVCGVGHSSYETILDYVADVSVKTPTAAADAVIPIYDDETAGIEALVSSMEQAVTSRLRLSKGTIDSYRNHRAFAGGFIDSRRTYLSGLTALLEKHNPSSELADRQRKLYEQKLKLEVFPERLERLKIEQDALASRLESVNPDNVLSRGYSYVESEEGNAIDSVAKVTAGQEVKIVFADGTAKSTIIDTGRKEG